MILIKKEAWSHDLGEYIIKGFEMQLTPADMLIVSKALRLLQDNEEVHPNDRKTAGKMIQEIKQQMKGE